MSSENKDSNMKNENENEDPVDHIANVDEDCIQNGSTLSGASVNGTLKVSKEVKSANIMNINKRSFIVVMLILLGLVVIVGLATYCIPKGAYARDSTGALIQGSYHLLGGNGNYPIWRWLTAPFEVFASSDALVIIMISLFIMILSATFNIMDKTNGIKVVVRKLADKFAARKNVLLAIIVLVFMCFGSIFGMFEELVALLPLVTIIALSLGYDTMTGMTICMVASCFGFAAAISNPFSVGLIASIAGINIMSGVWLRLICFVLIYGIVLFFLFQYTRKLDKNPMNSLTYQEDLLKKQKIFQNEEIVNSKKILKTYLGFIVALMVVFVGIVAVPALQGISVPVLAITFLLGGLICGTIITKNFKQVGKWFCSGLLSMLPAVVMIAFASSVKFIMVNSQTMDTVMHVLIGFLSDKSPFVSILLLYGMILFLQLFIGSATAKVLLVMPIVLPICANIGLSENIAILAFVFGDGFTNILFPTNAVLLVGLSMAGISYGKWFKWIWKLQLFMLILTALILLGAVAIGY